MEMVVQHLIYRIIPFGPDTKPMCNCDNENEFEYLKQFEKEGICDKLKIIIKEFDNENDQYLKRCIEIGQEILQMHCECEIN